MILRIIIDYHLIPSSCCYFQSQQRELTIRHAKEAEKEMKHRLTLQKNEYEETIKRHLSFIDQVSLNTCCS